MGNYTKLEAKPTSEQIHQGTLDLLEAYDPKLIMTNKQLEEKAEDDLDFDEDDFMKDYRDKRIAELQAKAALHSFGYLREIVKPEWEKQVTHAPKDVHVVIHLYQD